MLYEITITILCLRYSDNQYLLLSQWICSQCFILGSLIRMFIPKSTQRLYSLNHNKKEINCCLLSLNRYNVLLILIISVSSGGYAHIMRQIEYAWVVWKQNCSTLLNYYFIYCSRKFWKLFLWNYCEFIEVYSH